MIYELAKVLTLILPEVAFNIPLPLPTATEETTIIIVVTVKDNPQLHFCRG